MSTERRCGGMNDLQEKILDSDLESWDTLSDLGAATIGDIPEVIPGLPYVTQTLNMMYSAKGALANVWSTVSWSLADVWETVTWSEDDSTSPSRSNQHHYSQGNGSSSCYPSGRHSSYTLPPADPSVMRILLFDNKF
ncbi:uncharacterized protein [Ptychodera flava]|uniref:uncharacterized protein n=1 Tax=Ptychodera flava TaxID=63121 RepID=UPI003969D33E